MSIEKREESPHDRKVRMLRELKTEVITNYNMTDDDFNRLVNKAAMAMKEGAELDWNFWNSCRYVFAALTTIGKDTQFSSYVTNATQQNGIYFLQSIRRLISYSCYLLLRVEGRKASSLQVLKILLFKLVFILPSRVKGEKGKSTTMLETSAGEPQLNLFIHLSMCIRFLKICLQKGFWKMKQVWKHTYYQCKQLLHLFKDKTEKEENPTRSF